MFLYLCHDLYLDANVLGSVDDALGDDIALHDAAENVDKDGLHVAVARQKTESGSDLAN